MSAVGPVSPPVPWAPLPAGSRGGAPSAAADGGARRGPHQPDIRLEIRRDHDIDRVVFEYRRRSDGELVQRFPARQVVRFYQMIDSLVPGPDDPAGRLPALGADPRRPDGAEPDRETTSAQTDAVERPIRAEG